MAEVDCEWDNFTGEFLMLDRDDPNKVIMRSKDGTNWEPEEETGE